jgi:type II secretory pathway pseudopilin PulG
VIERRAFTLLEAVLALAMLTAVIIVCLQMRAQVGMVGRQVERIAARDNAAEALFQSLVNGLLGAPVDSEKPGAMMWEGVQNGEKYKVVRTATRVPNPVVGQVDFDVPATLTAYRYEITLGNTTSEFIWHR